MPLFDSKTKSKGGFDSDDEKGGDGSERMLEHFLLHSLCVEEKRCAQSTHATKNTKSRPWMKQQTEFTKRSFQMP